ncbi:SgcJ/EcaC family oxidoreductase [Streptomyces sp. NPDC000405]|uniref:SgcJ/EcaC family oxidoreductase n=1 Tax=Streptomyces sp. NPDC000405 TaxID=3161033 RepID=UPI00398CDB86
MGRRTYSAAAAVTTVTVLFTGTGVAQAADHRPHFPSEREIRELFDRWNAALATLDADRVADLYAPDAVLLPTVSAEIRKTRAARIDYFKHFLENKPVGRIQERVINILGRTSAIDTGLYQFTLTDKHGHRSKVDARYTFVYKLRGGKWLIINHHSSKLPTG